MSRNNAEGKIDCTLLGAEQHTKTGKQEARTKKKEIWRSLHVTQQEEEKDEIVQFLLPLSVDKVKRMAAEDAVNRGFAVSKQ